MRILVFNWKDPQHPLAGGAEVYTAEVARRWVSWGHQVTWFAAAAPPLPARDRLDGIEVVRRGGRLGVYREAGRFYRSEARGRFDLVIDEINTRPFLCPRFVDDVPVVALAHQVAREVWWYEAPLPVAAAGRFLLEPRWLSFYRHVPTLTVSESSRASLAAYGLRRVELVPEGTSHHPIPHVVKRRRPTLVFLGRLSGSKRPQHAFEAFALLRRRHPHAEMWVVGSGPLEDRLRRTAPEGVTLLGKVDEEEKLRLLQQAHLLVATSVREGWGLVVDEAAAAGTRTVAYDVPGLRESVTAAGGRLTPPHPRHLAEALDEELEACLADPPSSGWRGGAVPWDEVAAAVLTTAASAGGLTVDPAATGLRGRRP